MKYLKKYKLFETGEWSRDVDWDYVKDNPDDDSEEANWIKDMEKRLTLVQNALEGEEIPFDIIDIKGFDMYQGPYATILIDNSDRYTVWFADESGLWIENFPIDNMSPNENPGFKGYEDEIIDVIIDEYKPINKELRKYNI